MKDYIEKNLKTIKDNITIACNKVNRDPKEITILGVTKGVDIEDINKLIFLGIKDVGENKAQELSLKYKNINDNLRWHFIGNLQTNKVKSIIDKVTLIHSLNSLKLAEEINKRAQLLNKNIDLLIEVNISKEKSKCGIYPENIEEFVNEITKFSYLKIKGLMAIAPYVEKAEKNREHFINMRKIFIDIKNKNKDNINMKYLSMGMSNDYQIAIEEGANIVRIGSALFKAD